MTGLRQRLLGLVLPPLMFCLVDVTLTLLGQSEAYWKGDFSQVNEASPTFHHLLAWHPAAFLIGELIWIGLFVGILLLLPETPALILSIAITLGHVVGAATWILYRFRFGYQACNALFLLAAIALGLGIRWGWEARPPQEYRPGRLSLAWRWGLSAVLFAIGVWLYLWPRDA